ncbi:MAG TPA: hypothetical protein VMB34_20425 [Acetobacteraceae bacterium]|nr:hypothetical protein [Acetobacteraceae bacterium]
MDQCTLGALRARSDRVLAGPKISITVRTPLIDHVRLREVVRMEQEQRKTGGDGNGQSYDAQPADSGAKQPVIPIHSSH